MAPSVRGSVDIRSVNVAVGVFGAVDKKQQNGTTGFNSRSCVFGLAKWLVKG
jgi:hypothetical protein